MPVHFSADFLEKLGIEIPQHNRDRAFGNDDNAGSDREYAETDEEEEEEDLHPPPPPQEPFDDNLPDFSNFNFRNAETPPRPESTSDTHNPTVMPSLKFDILDNLPHTHILDAKKKILMGNIQYEGGDDLSTANITHLRDTRQIKLTVKKTRQVKSARSILSVIAEGNTVFARQAVIVLQARLNREHRENKETEYIWDLPSDIEVVGGFIDPTTYQEAYPDPLVHTCTVTDEPLELSAGFGFFFMLVADDNDAPLQGNMFGRTMNGRRSRGGGVGGGFGTPGGGGGGGGFGSPGGGGMGFASATPKRSRPRSSVSSPEEFEDCKPAANFPTP